MPRTHGNNDPPCDTIRDRLQDCICAGKHWFLCDLPNILDNRPLTDTRIRLVINQVMAVVVVGVVCLRFFFLEAAVMFVLGLRQFQ